MAVENNAGNPLRPDLTERLRQLLLGGHEIAGDIIKRNRKLAGQLPEHAEQPHGTGFMVCAY